MVPPVVKEESVHKMKSPGEALDSSREKACLPMACEGGPDRRCSLTIVLSQILNLSSMYKARLVAMGRIVKISVQTLRVTKMYLRRNFVSVIYFITIFIILSP